MMRYAVTQRSKFAGGEIFAGSGTSRVDSLFRHAQRWSAEGVDFVQLREKDLAAGALVELAGRLVLALGAQTKLLVNGRVDVAVAAGAAGVHLTAQPDEVNPAQVRRVFALADAGEPIISVSCHTLSDVERARDSGADLILFGPVFEKRIGDRLIGEGAGLEMLRQACDAAAPSRVLALGGVTRENAAACTAAGAAGVAGIRLFS